MTDHSDTNQSIPLSPGRPEAVKALYNKLSSTSSLYFRAWNAVKDVLAREVALQSQHQPVADWLLEKARGFDEQASRFRMSSTVTQDILLAVNPRSTLLTQNLGTIT